MTHFSRTLGAGAVAALLALVGCATPPAPTPSSDPVAVQLDRLFQKSAEQAAFTGSADAKAPAPRMADGKLWVTWRGDANDLLRNLEPVTGQKLSVTGPTPRLPLYVQVHALGVPVDEVMRDIGYQLGQRADLVLLPSGVEIRYRAF
ncbi:DotD/TraH family lipoprotein [Variovorax sp. JS1663]|uniref:DotD/TraH family lipoprotein n=1 Tax=Variovorax sp. JS1663 TaxID=1851577 RepID=UPI000B349156|nr:DotD/TraH family lipoprotein [Variovorax sp. JS1663]